MNPALELAQFAAVMALGQFSPGPDMILLTRTALADGAKAGAKMALGIATGLTVHASIAVAGLAVVFEQSPNLRQWIAWLAAGYLLWLAWCLIRAAWSSTAEVDGADAAPTRRPFFRGLICNLLNPKAVFFLAAVCAPFLRGGHPSWWPFAIVAVVIVQGGVLWALWARLLQWPPLRTRYERSARWIDGAFGVVLAALALKLLIAL